MNDDAANAADADADADAEDADGEEGEMWGRGKEGAVGSIKATGEAEEDTGAAARGGDVKWLKGEETPVEYTSVRRHESSGGTGITGNWNEKRRC